MANGLIRCSRCKQKALVFAGTIFHETRKPLRLWLQAIRNFDNRPNIISSSTTLLEIEAGQLIQVFTPNSYPNLLTLKFDKQRLSMFGLSATVSKKYHKKIISEK